MPSTEENTTNTVAFANSTALAEQTMSGPGSASGIQGEPVGAAEHFVPRPQVASWTTVACQKQLLIQPDNAPGLLPIWREYTAYGSRPQGEFSVWALPQVSVGTLLGLRGLEQTDTTNHDYVWYGNDRATLYQYLRLKRVRLELSNFLLIVERDASGGVQIVDPASWRIVKNFLDGQVGPNEVTQTVAPHFIAPTPSIGQSNNSWVTDLKRGLHSEHSITTIGGWVPYYRCYWVSRNPDGTGIYSYPALGQWVQQLDAINAAGTTNELTSEFPTSINGQGAFFRSSMWLDHPGETFSIAVDNIPELTNVTFHLSYTSKIYADWEGMGLPMEVFTNLPVWGGAAPTTRKGEAFEMTRDMIDDCNYESRKRKRRAIM
jgi:hypothetical protein